MTAARDDNNAAKAVFALPGCQPISVNTLCVILWGWLSFSLEIRQAQAQRKAREGQGGNLTLRDDQDDSMLSHRPPCTDTVLPRNCHALFGHP